MVTVYHEPLRKNTFLTIQYVNNKQKNPLENTMK